MILQKKTGQGLAATVIRHFSSEYSELLDELLAEGKIDSYIDKYNTLPDDEWVVPAGCYNAIKDDKTDHHGALTFTRIYLGIETNDILGRSNNNDLYTKWYEDNKTALENMISMEEIQVYPIQLDSTEIEHLKSHTCYTKNNLISTCLKKIVEKNDIKNKALNLYKELIPLYESSGNKYLSELKKAYITVDELSRELKINKKIISYLNTQTKTEHIQNIIK